MGEVQIEPQYPVEVVVLSKKLIIPTTPTPSNLRKLKISALDQIYPATYFSSVCYFPSTDKDQKAKNAERIKQLETAISEVLTLFYPLAGRYIHDNLLIECNDNGAEFIVTQVSGELAPLLGRDIDSRHLSNLIPNSIFEPLTSPLLVVQCNMFECGGLAIATSISHKIVDGFSFAKFIGAWATASRVGLHKVDHPNFDLPLLLPTRESMPDLKPVPRYKPGLKTASKTFVFDSLAISKLKEIARGSKVLKQEPSRVQLVTTVIWKALITAAQSKHGQLRPSVICQMINMRRRTSLPISENWCGNLTRPTTAKFTPDNKKTEVELCDLVSLVGDAIINGVTECARPQSFNDLFSMVINALRELDEFYNDNTDGYVFTSMCKMPIYPDFGWGKAAQVTQVQSVVEFIILMDTRDGDGIEALISLDENDMLLFQQDPDLIAFTSQVGFE